MKPDPLLQALDELERRHRRDYGQVRTWLFSVTKGPDGPISPPPLDDEHNRSVVPLLLDYEDVADALQVSPTTVKRLVRAGELPAVKVARSSRVRRCDLDAYVESLATQTHPHKETR